MNKKKIIADIEFQMSPKTLKPIDEYFAQLMGTLSKDDDDLNRNLAASAKVSYEEFKKKVNYYRANPKIRDRALAKEEASFSRETVWNNKTGWNKNRT
jgi:hypothetical protein